MIDIAADDQDLLDILKRILFHLKVNKWYEPKLAQLIIRIHLDHKFEPDQRQLDRSLCMAAYLGDSASVKLLLDKGANCNLVNKQHYSYTPIVYAILQEHYFSRIKEKSSDIELLITSYEETAKILIERGADVKRKICNGLSNDPSNKTYIFMQTCNENIFNLFEEQIADELKNKPNLSEKLVVNAFKFGNAQFIKKLYGNSLYRDFSSKCKGKHRHWTFMDLAIQYYKGHDFEELYNFLDENNERPSDEHFNLKEFGLQCLDNAMDDLDFESIKKLYQEGVSLNNIYQSDNSTYLINCIKRANSKTKAENIIQIIELLIQAGVNFSHQDIAGKTALDYAIEQNLDPKIIQALICTPVIYAITQLSTSHKIDKLIIEAKNRSGKLSIYKDSQGKSALDYAEELNMDSWIIDALSS